MSGVGNDTSKGQGEFAAEAQETIEAFGRTLLELEAQQKANGAPQPDTINAAFRVMHTLKGSRRCLASRISPSSPTSWRRSSTASAWGASPWTGSRWTCCSTPWS